MGSRHEGFPKYFADAKRRHSFKHIAGLGAMPKKNKVMKIMFFHRK
jgi:hypothetical protein